MARSFESIRDELSRWCLTNSNLLRDTSPYDLETKTQTVISHVRQYAIPAIVNLGQNYPLERNWRGIPDCYSQRCIFIQQRFDMICGLAAPPSHYDALDIWIYLDMLGVQVGRLIKDWPEVNADGYARSMEQRARTWQVSRPMKSPSSSPSTRVKNFFEVWYSLDKSIQSCQCYQCQYRKANPSMRPSVYIWPYG